MLRILEKHDAQNPLSALMLLRDKLAIKNRVGSSYHAWLCNRLEDIVFFLALVNDLGNRGPKGSGAAHVATVYSPNRLCCRVVTVLY